MNIKVLLTSENLKKWLPFTLLFTVAFIGCLWNIHKLSELFFLDGPNTVGEAGKVFYSNRIKDGYSCFLPGNVPPFYPSFHGVITHLAVGIPAKLFNLDFSMQYYWGRCISLSALIFSFIIGWKILIFFNVRFVLKVLWLLLFLATPTAILNHCVSYRPDFWNMAISLTCFYLLIKEGYGKKRFALLIILSLLAFFIKATGLIIPGAIFWTFVASGEKKRASLFGLTFGATLIFLLLLINFSSDGAFFSSFISGMKVAFSYQLPLNFLSITYLWIPVACVLISLTAPSLYGHAENKGVFVFPLILLIGIIMACCRTGSNSYYFIDIIAIGFILLMISLNSSLAVKKNATLKADGIIIITLGIIVFFAVRNSFLHESTDIAIIRTKHYGTSRKEAADFINSNNLYCYSDDPGLNVMLKKPAIIYPIIISCYEKSGALPKDFRIKNLQKREYDILFLTKHNWDAFGLKAMPDNVVEAITKNYKFITVQSKYNVAISANIEKEGK